MSSGGFQKRPKANALSRRFLHSNENLLASYNPKYISETNERQGRKLI
jgi:hypothetical protein